MENFILLFWGDIMYDMHYDLLTILYFTMSDNNIFANKEKLFYDLQKIYRNDNILGGIINLYFMTKEEMKEELDITYAEMVDIKGMFLKSITLLEMLKKCEIIPIQTKFLYGIEGCDYIKNEQELEDLYRIGLRSIILVWNHKNQYGSGIRTKDGLTNSGRSVIKKALDLGIIIDVSHANEETFYDTINVYESFKKDDSILLASHSNVRSICNRKRNLSDQELYHLKQVNGYIGLFTNGNFVSLNNKNLSYKERQHAFMKHLEYLIDSIGFDIYHIIIATDDMNYHPNSIYHHLEVFPIETVARDLFTMISNKYDEYVATRIMKDNAKEIIDKII